MAQLKNTTINTTGFFKLPIGTTSERPGSPQSAQIRLNSTTGKIEFYQSDISSWTGTSGVGVIASGGNSVYDIESEGATYRVHVFTSTGNSTFTVTKQGTVEYLIVGGGGGGSGNFYDDGAGGGAGGLITGFTTVTPQAYTITVGAGGPKSSGGAGNNGGNSVAFGLTALGGGGGASHRGAGQPGGSGGGGAGYYGNDGLNYAGGAAQQPGSASGGFGNPGGGYTTGEIGGTFLYPNSSGGGGAGFIGGRPSNSSGPGGQGGNGLMFNISGIPTYYAGGGGGLSLGLGGLGGGARASTGRGGSPAENATPNTGGGGGGGRQYTGETGIPSDGGSGIVIIRYLLQPENPQPSLAPDPTNGLLFELDFAGSTAYLGAGNRIRSGVINGTLPYINPRTHRGAFRGDGSASNNILLDNHVIPTGGQITLIFYNFGRTARQSSIISGLNAGGTTTQDINIHLPWVDGTIYWDVGDPFDRLAVNVSSVYQGWNHWVFTHNTSTGFKRIYRNGSEIASGPCSSSIPTMETLRLFAYHSLNYGHDGDVALFRSYNRELTTTEITNHFTRTRWRFGL